MKNRKLPKTVPEALTFIEKAIGKRDKNYIRKLKKNDLYELHMTLGMWIRNNLGMWGVKNNRELMVDILRLDSGSPRKPIPENLVMNFHPDNASHVLIEELWKKLRRKNGSKK